LIDIRFVNRQDTHSINRNLPIRVTASYHCPRARSFRPGIRHKEICNVDNGMCMVSVCSLLEIFDPDMTPPAVGPLGWFNVGFI